MILALAILSGINCIWAMNDQSYSCSGSDVVDGSCGWESELLVGRWNLDDEENDPEDFERKDANRQLASQVYRLQNPKDCATTRLLVAKHWSINCGFGADMHVMSAVLHVALMLNRTLVVDDRQWWWFAKNSASHRSTLGLKCDPDTSSCLFMPVSRCKIEDIPRRLLDQSKLFLGDSRVDPSLSESEPWAFQEDRILRVEKPHRYYCDHMHPGFQDMGELWYRSKLMQFLMKLTPASTLALSGLKSRIGLTNPAIGVHVRRGDNYENPNFSFETYSKAVEFLQKDYDINTIFLASDDQNAIEDAIRKNWVTMANPKRYRGAVKTDHGEDNGAKYYDMPADFAESWDFFAAVFELLLLAECDHLVASLGSNFGRLAFELMHANKPSSEVVTLDVDYHYFK